MGERAVVLVLALVCFTGAVSCLVFLDVVEAFNFVVGELAVEAFRALVYILAEVWRVVARCPSPSVDLRVEEAAVFVIVLLSNSAG